MKLNKLGELVKIRTGKLDANANKENGEYPFFTCSINNLWIDTYAYDCECILVAGNGDLNVKYYNGKFNAYQRTYIVESIDNNILFTKYLYYFMSKYIETLRRNSIGGVIKYIKLGDLSGADIFVPPLEKQKKIVELLDEMGTLIELRKQQITALSNLKQSIFYDMFGDPQLNNKKWKLCKIGDLTKKTQYGSSKKASLTDGEFAMLRMNNITYKGDVVLDELKYVNLDEKEKEKHLVHKGELLFNRTNSKELVGKTAVYDHNEPIAYAGYLIKLIPNELANSYFISGYLNSNYGKRYLYNLAKNIVGMANINAKELRGIPIYMPPKKLQDEYEYKIKKINKSIDLFKQGQTELEMLYGSLMQKAFKGELFN